MDRKPIKIMYLMDRYWSPNAGTERQLLKLLTHLDRKRFDPCLVVFHDTSFLRSSPFPCPVQSLDFQKIASLRTIWKLLTLTRMIRIQGIRLVHIFLNDASIMGPVFCKLGGAKVVVSRRDMGFWYTPAKLAALRVGNLFVDRVVANCQAVGLNVVKREKVPAEKMTVIYNGQECELQETLGQGSFWESLGIGKADPVVGMVANLYPGKRHQDMVRAFAVVHERFPTAHLMLPGEGEEEAPLRRLVTSLGLDGKVHFLGPMSDVIPVIRRCNVCVLCSESEGLPNAVLEYMSCGKPTVCTRVGGAVELIEDGQSGFMIDVGDVEALAERIIPILSDEGLAQRLGCSARKRIAADFSLDGMVQAHGHLYADLLGQSCNE